MKMSRDEALMRDMEAEINRLREDKGKQDQGEDE